MSWLSTWIWGTPPKDPKVAAAEACFTAEELKAIHTNFAIVAGPHEGAGKARKGLGLKQFVATLCGLMGHLDEPLLRALFTSVQHQAPQHSLPQHHAPGIDAVYEDDIIIAKVPDPSPLIPSSLKHCNCHTYVHY
jgi:hypothetical protein